MIKSFLKAALAGLIAFAVSFGAFALFLWMSSNKKSSEPEEEEEEEEEEHKEEK